MSIRLRLALFGLLVASIALTTFTLAFYGLLTAGGSNSQDEELSERADQALASLATADASQFRRTEMPAPVDPEQSVEMFVMVLGADGVSLSSTGAIDGAPPAIPADVLAAASASGTAEATIEPKPGVRVRIQVRPWSRNDLGTNGFVAVAQSTRRVENDLRVGRIFLIAAAIFAFIVAAIAIWLVIGRALRPLKQLAALTNEVGLTRDLSQRLPVPRPNDEVRALSESFNGMMSRLEVAHDRLSNTVDAQRRFVADASHELRTPVTTIRSNAGFLLQHPEAREDDRLSAIEDIASESERMSRMIHDLLTLARADGGHHLERTSVDLASIARGVVRQAANVHMGRQFRADLDEASISGNEDALKQLLWILLDNAVRHTTEEGRIRVALAADSGTARLMVVDDGEGIPPADLPHVFDRFYQADVARSNGGSGLGLSIAQWIVEEHGGSISAHNNDHGGATIRIELPAGDDLSPTAPPVSEGESATSNLPDRSVEDLPLPHPTT